MKVGKVTSILLALLSCVSWLLATDQTNESLRFSRPTVKGIVLTAEPLQVHKLYKDEQYEFAYCGQSDFAPCDRDSPPSLFVKDRVRERWILVTDLSTENARLGKSFVHNGGDESDFRGFENSDYAHLPIKIRGTKMLPDRITFDQKNGLYRLDFNYQLNLSITLSYFWLSKTDLDTVQ